MARPLVALIYAEGCPACSDAKPRFKKLADSMPELQFGMLNIEKPGVNLDFVVEYTPTLYMQIGQRRFVTNPAELGVFTEALMRKWVNAVLEKVKGSS